MLRKWLVRAAVAAGALAAAAFVLGGLAWWFESGPGFRRQCERLAGVAGIGPGMTVADVGAGDGRVAVYVASRVGPTGRVYATELLGARIDAIRQRAAGLGNVTAVKAGVDATGLSTGCCDVIYLRRVYHHLSDARTIVEGLAAALRPGGRLVVIDFVTPGWAPRVFEHGVAAEAVRESVEAAGLPLERRIERWSPIDYCLVFRRGV